MAALQAPALGLSEFKKRVNGVLEEYFSSGDAAEALTTITELGCPSYHFDVVKRAISLSLDRTGRERELVSKLFCAARERACLSIDQLGKGFERVFEFVDDMELDAPGATDIVASFLARAVADELLPSSFLVDPLVVGLGGAVIPSAHRKLQDPNPADKIWGLGDGRPVGELRQAIDALIRGYLASGDLAAAEQALREMRVPHFHHEVVMRGVAMLTAAAKNSEECDDNDPGLPSAGQENGNTGQQRQEGEWRRMLVLFRHLRGVSLAITDEVLTEGQLQLGLARAHSQTASDGGRTQQQLACLEFVVREAIEQGLVKADFKIESPAAAYCPAASRLGFEHPDYIPTSEPTSPFFGAAAAAAADTAGIEELAI